MNARANFKYGRKPENDIVDKIACVKSRARYARKEIKLKFYFVANHQADEFYKWFYDRRKHRINNYLKLVYRLCVLIKTFVHYAFIRRAAILIA